MIRYTTLALLYVACGSDFTTSEALQQRDAAPDATHDAGADATGAGGFASEFGQPCGSADDCPDDMGGFPAVCYVALGEVGGICTFKCEQNYGTKQYCLELGRECVQFQLKSVCKP